MDINKLREQLKIDEGVKYEVYLDHLGYKTFGIGHLVVAGDDEYKKVRDSINDMYSQKGTWAWHIDNNMLY